MRAPLLLLFLCLQSLSTDAVNFKKLLGRGKRQSSDDGIKDPSDPSSDLQDKMAKLEQEKTAALSETLEALETIQKLATQLEESQASLKKAQGQADGTLEQTKKWWQAKADDVERDSKEQQAVMKKEFEEALAKKEQEIAAVKASATAQLAAAKKEGEAALQKKAKQIEQEIAALEQKGASKGDAAASVMKREFEESLAKKEQEIAAIKINTATKLAAAKKEATDALEKSAEEIVALRREITASKEKASTAASEETLRLAHNEMKQKVIVLEGGIVALKEKHAQEIAQLKQASVRPVEVEGKARELQEKHDQKHAELELAKKQAEEEKQALLREKEEQLNKLSTDLDSHKRSIEEKHNEEVKSLKVEMETKEKKAMDLVKAREVELESKMDNIKAEAEKLLKVKEGDHSKERQKLVQSIKDMEHDHAQLEKKMTQLDSKYSAAAKEIDEWQTLYKARSYCNFTYMHEDAAATVATVSKVATEQITATTRSVSRTASERFVMASAALDTVAKPHISTGRNLYNQHVKEHVDKHVVPIHENHVQPVITTVKDMVSTAYNGMISEFKATCPQLKGQAKDYELHPTVRTFIREKCRDPKDTVNRFLRGVVILLCIIFRNPLWRVLVFVVYLPFRILWYCTPLPLLFPSKTKDATTNGEPVSAVKVKKNGSAAKGKKTAPMKTRGRRD